MAGSSSICTSRWSRIRGVTNSFNTQELLFLLTRPGRGKKSCQALPGCFSKLGKVGSTKLEVAASHITPADGGVFAARAILPHAIGMGGIAHDAIDCPDHRAGIVVSDDAVLFVADEMSGASVCCDNRPACAPCHV